MTDVGLLGPKPLQQTPSFAPPMPAIAGHISADVAADTAKLSPAHRAGILAVAARK
jgi:hypothetical protein